MQIKRYNLAIPIVLHSWLTKEAKEQSRSLCKQINYILKNEMENKKAAAQFDDEHAALNSVIMKGKQS